MAWKLVKVIGWVDDGPPSQGAVDPGYGQQTPPGMNWGGSGQPQPGGPPGIWGGGNEPFPTPPIAPGGPPPGVWPGPGQPSHPIAPGGPPPRPEHPIPPGIWPEPPGESATPPWAPHPEHPIPPGIWPSPPGGGGGEGSPPGIWGGKPPEYIDIGGPRPQPPGGVVTPPIYLPPTIWPDPPEGFPSFDEGQLPGHPDLPDLNHGVWYWVDNDGAMCRCFITQTVRASADLPDYQPNLPPDEAQPGEWVVVLVNAQRPAWGWIPSGHPDEMPPPDGGDHVEHHDKAGAKTGKA
jgi:hypothetical protein